MHLSIVTPERIVFSEAVESVSLPTREGEITVLENHISLVSILQPGELLIRKGDELIPLAVSGGVVQVRQGVLTILADTAERVEEIIEERAEAARARAALILAEKKFDITEYATISAKMEKELARVKVAQKWKTRRVASTAGSKAPESD